MKYSELEKYIQEYIEYLKNSRINSKEKEIICGILLSEGSIHHNKDASEGERQNIGILPAFKKTQDLGEAIYLSFRSRANSKKADIKRYNTFISWLEKKTGNRYTPTCTGNTVSIKVNCRDMM